jgi:hypothetical protein
MRFQRVVRPDVSGFGLLGERASLTLMRLIDDFEESFFVVGLDPGFSFQHCLQVVNALPWPPPSVGKARNARGRSFPKSQSVVSSATVTIWPLLRVAAVRSSAAEYLTFVAASGTGGVEAVYADER